MTAPLRFLVFDIETSALEASYGRLLCVCAKFTDEKKVHVIKAPRLRHERAALEKFRELWNAADVVVGWNSKLFDQAFLNGRLVQYGAPPLAPRKHIDLMYQARKLRLRGSRLDGVSKDLRTEYAKYDVPARRWVEAVDGSREALNEIVEHCRFDVLLTEEMLRRLKPLIVNITR